MSFKDDIKRFRQKAEKATEYVFRGTVLDLLSQFVLRTPVGNPSTWKSGKAPKGYTGGRLRANWNVTLNSPSRSDTEAKDKSGRSTISRGNKTISKAGLRDSVFIVNNLPYAQRVENGWSQQAPAGMVAVTVREFKAAVKRRARAAK